MSRTLDDMYNDLKLAKAETEPIKEMLLKANDKEYKIRKEIERYKLDNAATIYPSVMTKTWSAMFRLSVTLKENVDVEILKSAFLRCITKKICCSEILL